jgi:transcription antitermination protein NusB
VTANLAGRRSSARLAGVQALYQLEMAHAPTEAVIKEFIAERLGKDIDGTTYRDADVAWFSDVVRGVADRRAEIDGLLAGVVARELPRMEALLRATLRAATYEMIARLDVPVAVILNEYVDVAHAFFGGAEPAIVNGVLDRLARQLRPNELESRTGGKPSAAG